MLVGSAAGSFVLVTSVARASVCLEGAPTVTVSHALQALRASVALAEFERCAPGRLPATGHRSCWDFVCYEDGHLPRLTYAAMDCAGTGQDGDWQAGTPRSFVDNGDGTITDLAAGVMWEAKCDGPSCPSLHDKDTEYTWTEAFSVHVAALNATAFAGHSDWRMPNAFELDMLRDFEKQGAYSGDLEPYEDDGASRIATFDAFDNCTPDCSVGLCSCTAANQAYWSSSSHGTGYFGVQAWTFSLGDDRSQISASGKSRTARVRAVRSRQATSLPTDPPMVCSPDGGAASATDALALLQAASGAGEIASCPASPLPATNQRACSDVDGAALDCEDTGQDGDIRAGRPRSFTNHGNGTITDNATGLMWAAKCDGASCPPIHDKDTTYSWIEAFEEHLATLNATAFAGHTDWRLPNFLELRTLFDIDKRGTTRRFETTLPLAIFDAFDLCADDCDVTSCSCTSGSSDRDPSTYLSSTSWSRGHPFYMWAMSYKHFGGDGGAAHVCRDQYLIRAVRGGR